MRDLYTDFMRLDNQADGTIHLPLGTEDTSPDLVGLVPGERVRFVYPENLEAEGIVGYEEFAGRRYWYGVLVGQSAIRDIHPDSLAALRTSAENVARE